MSTNIKFNLHNIVTKQFATIDSIKVDDTKIDINFGFGFGINKEHRILGCHTKFEIRSNKKSFIILDVNCDFEIEETTWNSFIETKSNDIIFSKGFVQHIAVITVGTTRGVLHSKTENTPYNKYFLPAINVTEAITEDVTISLD
ncbi:MAG: hypothetical protein PF481_04095 [Bacteroidales bacterium]|jgi:hypothetical protein|nr:hypothetical protein [Bacteroidales bacterium]